MKKLITLLFASGFLFFAVTLHGQEFQKGNPGMWPAQIKYSSVSPAFSKTTVSIIDADGKSASMANAIIKNVERDAMGTDHYRYQQTVNGIAIEHADMLVHVANGNIKSQNGKWIKDFPVGLQMNPSVSESAALNKAMQDIGAKKYKWQIPAEEAFIKREQNNPKATFFPTATLVYYSGERDVIPSALRLAFKFDIYAQDPVSRQLFFVDATNGKILGKRELIHESNRTATAYTAYSGVQTITTDRVNNNLYRLRETGRGNGINTYNLQKGTNYGAAVDFTNNNRIWNNVNANLDQYATDAHWGTEQTYDYFLQKFGRNSIDNNGMALNSYVHYGVNYFNAFWDGNRMTYGDGDAAHGNKPLTSLDVCGHEITHGITERTSALVYSYESGAMNEGFSDIFGTAIEAFARPGNNDWLIGGDFFTIRNMSNPNAFGHPDTYLGTHWYAGPGDNGGVHYNSGVLNYWFYLLTTGGSGVNDHNYSFNVSGIGMDKAAAIAYRLNTVYLISTSQYNDARILGIQAAEDLFGVNSNEAIQTANAWSAVGLYAATCATATGLHETDVQDISARLHWNAVSGAASYQIEYRPNNTSYWYSAGNTADTTVMLNYIYASTLWDWRVKPDCNPQYSFGQFMSGAPVCREPSGLIYNVTSTTATLGWDIANYALSYDVDYKISTDNVWINGGNTTGITMGLTGLATNTTYDWRVRTNCTGGSSGYAVSQFNTGTMTCDAPSGLQVSYAPGLITTFTWNAVPGAVDYLLQLKWPGDPWTAAYDYPASAATLDITGFMSGMTLDWRVRTNCASASSGFTQSTLTTPCPVPTSIAVSGITSSGATVNWGAPEANSMFGYTLQFKLASATIWSSYSATSETSLTMSGLSANSLYDVRVRLNCYNITSVYAQTQFTTTAVACNQAPVGLNVSDLTTESVKLNWAAVPTAISYSLQYKAASATNWTTVSGLTGTSYNLGSLAASTGYNFKVQAVCASASSAYSAVNNFTTYCASSGTNSQDWIDYFSLGGITRSSGAELDGYIHTGMTMNLAIGSTGNSGVISADYKGSSKDENYAVYIDLNRNGSFDDPGERVAGQSSTSGGGNFNFSVNIPATATPGKTALRVVMRRQPTNVSSCMVGNRGETEDYFVNLTGGSTLQGFGGNPVTFAEPSTGSDISVGPNPSTGKYNLMINGDFKPVLYTVISVSGLPVKQGNLVASKIQQIDISAYPSGIYMLRLTDQQGEFRLVKLVKIK